MMKAVGDHTRPVLILFRVEEVRHALNTLEFYGLERAPPGCQRFVPRGEPEQQDLLYLCGDTRMASR